MNEITALKQLKHPNIVSLIEVNKTSFAIDLVFEHCDMTLKDVLQHPSNGVMLSCTVTYHIALLLFKALAHVHERRWLHRDLKPANILVKLQEPGAASGAEFAEPNLTSCVVKLADFGFARQVAEDKKVLLTKDVCTLWYRAPEILLGSGFYGCASDIWSMGCICAEMSEFKVTFADSSEIGLLFKIFRALGSPSEKEWPRLHGMPRYRPGLFPNFHGGLSSAWGMRIGPQYNALLQGVLRVAPNERWTAEAAAAYFQDGQICRMASVVAC